MRQSLVPKVDLIPAALSQQAQQIADSYRKDLFYDTLPFWLKHGLDQDHGGYLTSLDQDGTLLDSDKCAWQQGRFAWLLSKLANCVPSSDLPANATREDWIGAAELGVRFLEQHCFDPQDGRMWFHVTRTGAPIRKRRYAFSESFAAIAFAQFAKATNDDRLAAKAKECYQAFVRHQTNLPHALHKFEPTRPSKAIGTPMIAMATAQEIRDATHGTELDEEIESFAQEIERDFVKPNHQVVMETVTPSGEIIDHFDGRTLNPGHAIEGAWFLMREAIHQGQPQRLQLACDMTRWMFDRGWDPKHGGLRYFVGLNEEPVQEYWHAMKFWWVHAEAIIATLMGALFSGDQDLWERHLRVVDWSKKHFPDETHGEWFGYLNPDGSRSSTLKGNMWKGPFHIPRMQWECWQLWSQAARTLERG